MYEVENIKVIEKLLLDNGFKVLESIPMPGYERFEFRDPFGNRIECIQRLDD